MRLIRIGCICTMLPLVMAVFGGCGGSGGSMDSETGLDSPPDRFADLTDNDDRETVVISAEDPTQGPFSIAPASFDTVVVRAAVDDDSRDRVVEALVKGSFPDGCTELHEITQKRLEDRTTVTLTTRRPEQAVCTQVVRPYRFFFQLEGRYEPGSHVLQINGESYTYTVE